MGTSQPTSGASIPGKFECARLKNSLPYAQTRTESLRETQGELQVKIT